MAKKFDAKAKAKRQKIIAGVLGVLLVGVLAYQVPSLMKSKKPPVSSAPAPTGPPAGAPISGVPPVAGAPVSAPVPSTTLSDSDPAAQAGSGQLLSFDRFSGRDPFVQQAGTASTPSKTKWNGSLKPATPANPTPTDSPVLPKPPAAKPASAQISVNGVTEQVLVAATFPAGDPVFQLVSLGRTTAKIGIAGGSLSTGGTTTLKMGKKVTLMNTADGTRYDLVLISVS